MITFGETRMPFFFLLVILCAAALNAQQSQPEELPTYSETVDVSVINLYASVTDGKGRPVYGLKKEEFTLFQGGKQQAIDYFSADTTEPVTMILMLDTSGSMRLQNKFDLARDMIRGIVDKLRAEDEVALVTFGNDQVLPLISLTRNKKQILQKLDTIMPAGPTALWDAIVYCQKKLAENYGKKAIVLLTDGFDTRSEGTFEAAVKEASKVELPIYVFEIAVPEDAELKEEDYFDSPLARFAEVTAGLHFLLDPEEEKDIEKATAKIVEELKYQYYFGYSSSDPGLPRDVRLTTNNVKYRVRLRHSLY